MSPSEEPPGAVGTKGHDASAVLNAVVLAGGTVDGDLRIALGTRAKAAGRLGGVTLVERAIVAARGAGATRITVVGDDEVARACAGLADEIVPNAGDGSANVALALGRTADAPLLLLASDLPFVTALGIERFVAEADRAGSDVALPLATAARYDAVYPGAPPHITNVGGERIANGSVFYFAAGSGAKVVTVAQKLFEARKSLTKMALLLGPRLALKYASGNLRIDDIEKRAHEKFGVRARAIRDCAPDLCFDVDDMDDFRYAARLLGSRER